MNPIKNLWGTLVRRLYQDNKHYETINELKIALNGWTNLEPETHNNLVDSVNSRIFELIRKNGGPTHYYLKERFVKKNYFSAINHTNCLQLALHLLIIILFDCCMIL
jgi:hypothetical protein